jgi:hypothetical protein
MALVIATAALGLHCDRDDEVKSSLKGQSNTPLTFYGVAVDESGRPLEGAEFLIEVEAIPANWNFDNRGKPHDLSTVSATSGPDGRFQFDITGHILRFKRVERDGYRHFYDLDIGATNAVDNMAYRLNAWSDRWYRSDRENPAVYVFVREGVREVYALPARGGSNSANGKHWTLNKPGWPEKPSLKDVVQKQTSTHPTTNP